MIYMTCPMCEAPGRIPDEKVNTAIVCKKCLKTFHVKPSGHAVPGGPPIPESELHPQKVEEFDIDKAFEKGVENFKAFLRKLVPISVTLAVGAAAFVAYFWAQPSIEERATAMGTALARGDQDAIRTLAVSGTDDAAVEWLKALHPEVKESIQATPTSVPIVTVIGAQPEPKTGEVVVRARISPELFIGPMAVLDRAPPSASDVARSIDVVLVLKNGAWTGWRLDGKRALRSIGKSDGFGSPLGDGFGSPPNDGLGAPPGGGFDPAAAPEGLGPPPSADFGPPPGAGP